MSTSIEWARNPDGSKGETWPVVTGCTPCSIGCNSCYAARMAATRLKHHPRYTGLAVFKNGKARWTGEVRLNHDVLEQPLHWVKPRRVFVASMSDWLHHDIPELFIYRVLDITQKTPQHIYQFLTKRADRLPTIVKDWMLDRGLYEPPSNVWQGVSVESQAAADERIPLLLQTPAAVRFVSVEPMLESVQITCPSCGGSGMALGEEYGVIECPNCSDGFPYGLNWVICGAESGPGARPMHPDWVRSLRDQCQISNTPYFFKQHGAWLHGSQFPLASPWAELQRDGARVHGRPVNWQYKADRIYRWPDGSTSYRIGKKRAGHLLDGRAWQEFPRLSTPGTLNN